MPHRDRAARLAPLNGLPAIGSVFTSHFPDKTARDSATASRLGWPITIWPHLPQIVLNRGMHM